jgi:hypothetical protein
MARNLPMIVILRSRSRRRVRQPKVDNSPSPEMIRELTAEIRKNWSTRDFRRRSSADQQVRVTQMPLEPRRKGFWGE